MYDDGRVDSQQLFCVYERSRKACPGQHLFLSHDSDARRIFPNLDPCANINSGGFGAAAHLLICVGILLFIRWTKHEVLKHQYIRFLRLYVPSYYSLFDQFQPNTTALVLLGTRGVSTYLVCPTSISKSADPPDPPPFYSTARHLCSKKLHRGQDARRHSQRLLPVRRALPQLTGVSVVGAHNVEEALALEGGALLGQDAADRRHGLGEDTPRTRAAAGRAVQLAHSLGLGLARRPVPPPQRHLLR
ncbi:hypothetical protein F4809DRAFT_582584 [Biscogniauxia mediterranea]|nr:hypothetical protein F4809DRAFT_582584 [Biscogniauxia mediterranea]